MRWWVILGLVAAASAGCRLRFDELDGASSADAFAGTPEPITFVQTMGTWLPNGTNATAVTMPGPIGAHDAILVAFYVKDLTASLTSIIDGLGNSYSIVLGPFDDSGTRFYFALATNALSGSTTVTAFLDKTPASAVEMLVVDYAGIADQDAVDTGGANAAVTSGLNYSMTGSEISTSAAGEVLLGWGCGPCAVAGTGMTQRTYVHGDIIEELLVDPGTHQLTGNGTCAVMGDRWQLITVALRPRLLL